MKRKKRTKEYRNGGQRNKNYASEYKKNIIKKGHEKNCATFKYKRVNNEHENEWKEKEKESINKFKVCVCMYVVVCGRALTHTHTHTHTHIQPRAMMYK